MGYKGYQRILRSRKESLYHLLATSVDRSCK